MFSDSRLAKKRAASAALASRKIEVLNMLLNKHFKGITLNVNKSFDYNRLYYDIDAKLLSDCQFLRYELESEMYDYSNRVQVYFLGRKWSMQEDGIMLCNDSGEYLETMWVISYRLLQTHTEMLVEEYKEICKAESLNMTSGLFSVFDIVQSLTERNSVPNVSFVLR